MSNTRHATGIPAAFPKVPPSPEAAGRNLGEVIGGAVAYHVAQLLGPVLQRVVDQRERPACLVCAARAKRAEREHEVARENALRAAEPGPEKPDMRVSESFTAGSRGPVCWSCFDPDLDGPFDMADYLPPAVD